MRQGHGLVLVILCLNKGCPGLAVLAGTGPVFETQIANTGARALCLILVLSVPALAAPARALR